MEEKNVTKISLSTFLLIIAIIAIIIMGVFIYNLNNEKTTEIQKISELQSQVNSLNGTINNLQEELSTISENINSNNSNENTSSDASETINSNSSNENTSSTKEYQISGIYYQKDALGDEPNYTFSSNNEVSYGSLWMCSGTYTISNNIIKINFTSAVDPDGNKANVTDFGVEKSVELTIIDNNTLKDNSNGFIYLK